MSRYTVQDQINAARDAVAFWDRKAEEARQRGNGSEWDRCGVERRAAFERLQELLAASVKAVCAGSGL